MGLDRTPQAHNRVRVGIVGAAGHRVNAYRLAFAARDRVSVEAVCDIAGNLDEAAERFNTNETYRDYQEMYDEADLDAVLIVTPQHVHAPQAAAALRRHIHVFSEVPAANSIEQAENLVAAARDSDAAYMLGENYTYFTSNVLVKQLVDAGLFGELYFAEGAYIYEMRDTMANSWRRERRLAVNGIPYGDHQVGPVLDWFEGDRIARVTCAGSGHHYTDQLGPVELEDTTMLLGETEQDRLVKIRLDALSNRPAPRRHAKYQLQGTAGCFESAIRPDGTDFVWLEDVHGSEDGRQFHDLLELEKYLPKRYRDPPPEFEEAGHYGADFFAPIDFLDALLDGEPMPIGLARGLDISLPGIVSRMSIDRDGECVEVPDPREW